MAVPEQKKNTYLIGGARDYPDPPGITEQSGQYKVWWNQMKALFRQHDAELEDLRKKVNSLSANK